MDYKKMKPIGLVKIMLTDGVITKEQAAKYFPELAENEDEKAINYIKKLVYWADGNHQVTSEQYNLIMTWLNKQGEQNQAVPKFRIGDKVKKGYLTYTVEDIGEDSYKLQAYSKDGDKGCTVYLTIGCEKDYELVEQKPVWSEEDKMMLQYAIEHFESEKRNCIEGGGRKKAMQEYIDWLKSLKDRVQPQTKQEWSEEDEEMLNLIIARLHSHPNVELGEYGKLYDWLNFHCSQKQWKPSEEMLEALYRALPQDVKEISEDEILLDKLYQGLKYGRVLSNNKK